jgi:hypothetical protein
MSTVTRVFITGAACPNDNKNLCYLKNKLELHSSEMPQDQAFLFVALHNNSVYLLRYNTHKYTEYVHSTSRDINILSKIHSTSQDGMFILMHACSLLYDK